MKRTADKLNEVHSDSEWIVIDTIDRRWEVLIKNDGKDVIRRLCTIVTFQLSRSVSRPDDPMFYNFSPLHGQFIAIDDQRYPILKEVVRCLIPIHVAVIVGRLCHLWACPECHYYRAACRLDWLHGFYLLGNNDSSNDCKPGNNNPIMTIVRRRTMMHGDRPVSLKVRSRDKGVRRYIPIYVHTYVYV